MTRRTISSALLSILAMAIVVSTVLAAPAHAAELSITATPSTGLTNDQTISVAGNAGTPNAPTLFVAVCEATPDATNCDQSLTGAGTPAAHILQVTPDPATGAWGPVDFHVRETIVTGNSPNGFDCAKTPTCVIGTTNSANPKDHTFNVTTALGFGAAAQTPTPTPSSAAATTDDGGSSPLVPIGIGVLVVVLAGLAVVFAKRRKGSSASV